MLSERRPASAQKRGGGKEWLSLNGAESEERFAREAATQETPEVAFERQWALTMLDQAMQQLEAECRRTGREALYRRLPPYLQGDHEPAFDRRVSRGQSRRAPSLLPDSLKSCQEWFLHNGAERPKQRRSGGSPTRAPRLRTSPVVGTRTWTSSGRVWVVLTALGH